MDTRTNTTTATKKSKPKGHIQFYESSFDESLRKRCAGGESISAVAQRAVHRYLMTCANSLPVLRVAEWCAIFDALNGTWQLDTWSPRYVYAEVHDCRGLGVKWGIDQAALVDTLMALDWGACMAIVDANEQFWARDDGAMDGDWYDTIAAIVGEDHIAKED